MASDEKIARFFEEVFSILSEASKAPQEFTMVNANFYLHLLYYFIFGTCVTRIADYSKIPNHSVLWNTKDEEIQVLTNLSGAVQKWTPWKIDRYMVHHMWFLKTSFVECVFSYCEISNLADDTPRLSSDEDEHWKLAHAVFIGLLEYTVNVDTWQSVASPTLQPTGWKCRVDQFISRLSPSQKKQLDVVRSALRLAKNKHEM